MRSLGGIRFSARMVRRTILPRPPEVPAGDQLLAIGYYHGTSMDLPVSTTVIFESKIFNDLLNPVIRVQVASWCAMILSLMLFFRNGPTSRAFERWVYILLHQRFDNPILEIHYLIINGASSELS